MTLRFHPTRWGAVLAADGRTRARLWAPAENRVGLRMPAGDLAMQPAGDGWFECLTDTLRPGDPYGFVLADGMTVPDPAARAQMDGVHGPSRLVDPRAYDWRAEWSGRPWEEAVICELHIGTFTEAGTFSAAAERLAHLADAGVTAIELMPVGQFSGRRGWGYDGVLPYAPHAAYGPPEAMKALVDAAHEAGLMVLLDVVYNHFGPDGNYLHRYAPDFFDESRQTPWGAAIAYRKRPVRDFFIDNALYWLVEYHLDGLRLDAVDQIRDPSEPELLVEIAERVRATITDRPIHLTTEDNRNITRLHERDAGRVRLYTGEWNDDFHNAAHVVATGESAGYYADFAAGSHSLLARALAEGFAYQGQASPTTGEPRGAPSAHLPPAAFVDFLQNHDQTGNRAFGERLTVLTEPALLAALQVIHLLSPHVPLIFMGEEYGEVRPFLFFTDFDGDLADAVREGRRREFADFPAFAADAGDIADIPDPNAERTFATSRLDWQHRDGEEGQRVLAATRHLLTLRAEQLAPRLAAARAGRIVEEGDGVVAIDWPVGGGTWRLRANLSDMPRRVPQAPGRLIHATAAPADPAPAHFAGYWFDGAG